MKTTIKELEYIDREHWSTVCIAEFSPITSLAEVAVGDFFIVPEKYLDQKTKLPVLLRAAAIAKPFHIRTSRNGSHAFDLCWKMINPA